jgi:hypothetical protein
MGRRRLLIMFALLLLPLVGLGVSWSIPPKPGVTKENFRRLQPGMMRAEVEAAMGDRSEQEDEGQKGAFVWRNGEVRILVLFDPQGRVHEAIYRKADDAPGELMPDGAWNRFCDWVKELTGG